jgi:hypothetical protein
MVSRAIWKKWVFQRLQIALVLRTRKNSFENFTRACFFSKLHSKPYYYLYKYQIILQIFKSCQNTYRNLSIKPLLSNKPPFLDEEIIKPSLY